MKKNLLIIVSRILQGGIDNILIEYLNQFERSKFNIRLAIGTCMGEHEICINNVPKDIEVHYLVKKGFLVKYRKMRSVQKVSLHKRVYDETLLNPIRRIIQKRTLNKLIKQSDVVIDFDSSFYSLLADCPLPKIAFFHFSFRQYHRGNLKKLERLGRKLDVYDKVVTICEDMRREGIEMYPHLKDKFLTIYNALDFEAIRHKSLEKVDSSLIEQPFVLAVQRLEEAQKDTTTLIKSFALLKEKYQISEKLYIIGDGKSKATLIQLAKDLGLQDEVIFLGLKTNPYPWIKASKLFVLSSKYEGLPTVLIEALSLNKTIVSTNCPTGPQEILDYGKAGVLVPMSNESRMAEAIREILIDPYYKDRLMAGIKQQIKKFDINNTIQQIESLLVESMEGSSLESGKIQPLIKGVGQNRNRSVAQNMWGQFCNIFLA